MAITFRDLKGSALTHPEMDTNLASYYLSSSVSGSTITFFRSGSDGLVISSSHTLTDITGSDTTYLAGVGLDLDTGSNVFSFQNGNNLNSNTVTKWNSDLQQLDNSIIYNSGSEAIVQGKLSVVGDIYQTGSKVELNVEWPVSGSEVHLLQTDGYILSTSRDIRSYEYSAIALDHFEEFPDYFHNSFRIYTQDSIDFNYGTYLNVGPVRTGMFVKPSGSAELANVSIQEVDNGNTLALVYATEVQIGAFNGEIVTIGNEQSDITIESLQTKISGSVYISGSVTADSLITRGGTSSQFVKGDGTLDSSTYLTESISSSYAESASYAATASYVLNATSASNVYDSTITLSAGSGLTGGGDFTTNQNTIETITFNLVSGVVSGSSQVDLSQAFGTASNAVSSSYAVTASHALNLKDGIDIVVNSGSFNYVTATSASFGFIESITGSAKYIGDAFVVVNSNSPTQRYSGLATFDSGSTNVTASLFFDSVLNDWNYEYDTSGSVDYGVMMFGPEYTVQGTPTYNTENRLVKANGGHHLEDSNISDNGTTVQVYSNIIVTGSVSGSTYYGDGSNLTGIASTDITSLNSKSGSWDTAVTWGDHSLEGYLTSYTETDPIFTAHTASSITSTQIGNWNEAHGWGDHSLEGYLTSYSETDTLQSVTTRGSSTTTTITAANFITTSDKRLKSDIKPIQEGLETIKKFVSYEYIKDGVQDAGFLAQEVQEAIPYSIGEREDGFLTMRDRPVLAHMHKAILELEARLAAIEEKLN